MFKRTMQMFGMFFSTLLYGVIIGKLTESAPGWITMGCGFAGGVLLGSLFFPIPEKKEPRE